MSLRKRGSVWWIDIATPSGERVRQSTETGNKAQAQELHDKLKRLASGSPSNASVDVAAQYGTQQTAEIYPMRSCP
jgi:hypothetical protein